MRSTLISRLTLTLFGAICLGQVAHADEGHPVALRLWPESGVTVETMWNFRVGIEGGQLDESELTKPGFDWTNATADSYVLDRKPNQAQPVVVAAAEAKDPSSNAVTITRYQAGGRWLTLTKVDGVAIVNLAGAQPDAVLAAIESDTALASSLNGAQALLVPSEIGEPTVKLVSLLKPAFVVARAGSKFPSDIAVEEITHNTLALSSSMKSADDPAAGKTRWVSLAETQWSMKADLADLFRKKEIACKASREVFAKLTVDQLNFKPSNGTHTPRWNTEHMMGRELLFFSQIYNAAEPAIPVLNLNPKQMPNQYVAAHADWTGVEEAAQTERVEAFTRRFAYLLDGLPLDRRPPGSRMWTPRALLEQMERHYGEHTANVGKKMELPEWPAGKE